jgi:hypothetical protein
MESPAHHALKLAAVRHLVDLGCTWAGTEVRGPLARFRVDAAGVLPPRAIASATTPAAASPAPSTSALFPELHGDTILAECKVSRADFLCCAALASTLRRRRDRLRLAAVEADRFFARHAQPDPADEPPAPAATLPIHSDRLFPHEPRPLHARARIAASLARIERRLYGGAKYDLFVRYRLADYLLLITTPGVLTSDEVPPGWGWAECHPDGSRLTLRLPPPRVGSTPRWRGALHRQAHRAALPSQREGPGVG